MARARPRAATLELTERIVPLSQQLRKARKLLSWSLDQASEQASLPASIIARAEIGDGVPDITLTQLARLQGAYQAAGVRIGHDGTVTPAQSNAVPFRGRAEP